MGRVHALRLPLSDYLRFEIFTGYVFTTKAGEDIRILDLDEHPTSLPDDFWIFDDQVVVGMTYGSNGEYVSAEILPDSELSKYLAYRDAALAHAEPLTEKSSSAIRETSRFIRRRSVASRSLPSSTTRLALSSGWSVCSTAWPILDATGKRLSALLPASLRS